MLPTISSPTDQRRPIDAVAYSNGLSMNCSLFAVLTFWLSTICAVGQPSSDQSAHPFLGGPALQTGKAGKASVPVFSSVDGYICFFLNAEVIRPAKRKVGIFTVPKHGLAVAEMSLDVRLCVPFGGNLLVNEKSNYRVDRRSYREVIGKPDASQIGAVFEPEINMHSYHF